MPYVLYTVPTARKALKRLSPQIREFLWEKMQVLTEEPRAGSPLQGKLKAFYSLHLRYLNTDYRIAYRVDDEQQHVTLYYAATRENFYKSLAKVLF